MGRDPIPRRRSFPGAPMRGPRSTRYQPRFPAVVPVRGEGRSRVTHPFATLFAAGAALTVRLACVRHAASVHPEPGSNSQIKVVYLLRLIIIWISGLVCLLFQSILIESFMLTYCLIFKVLCLFRLLYFINSVESCQQLFQKFFWSSVACLPLS